MRFVTQVMTDHTELSEADRSWLISLVREWHLLADTSFSDLILWLPDPDPNVYWAGAQIRPNTGPTALEDDVLGDQIGYDPEHLVTEAFMSQEICETSDNKLRAGIPVDVWAIPVIREGRCIAVVERHTNQMGVRAPGALEDCYLEIAEILSDMLWRGIFPVDPPSVVSLSPRVGDGLVWVTPRGVVSYVSPNAMSAYRRMGWSGDLEGEDFASVTLGLGQLIEMVGNRSEDIGVLTEDFGRRAGEYQIERANASMRVRLLPLVDHGRPAGVLCLCVDTTALRERERQLVTKDATIREIHHRVKNNLQTVAALLRLQSRRIQSPEGRTALRDAMSRVTSIAVVHEILSQAFDECVRFDDVADRILRMVGDVAAASGGAEARREGSFGMIPADAATSLSLAITELCQNAIEHGQRGSVVVRPRRESGRLTVEVVDEGYGLPADFRLGSTDSLGLSIVQTLVSDLGGTFTLENSAGGVGTTATISLPLEERTR